MPPAPDDLIHRAATVWGIEPEYWDIWGRKHVTSAETVRIILQGLGVATGDARALEAAIEERETADWRRLLEPAIVLDASAPLEVALSLPEEIERHSAALEIRREDGTVETRCFTPAALDTLGSRDIGGQRYLRKRLALNRLPPGYHPTFPF